MARTRSGYGLWKQATWEPYTVLTPAETALLDSLSREIGAALVAGEGEDASETVDDVAAYLRAA